jgi:hypothetical protein
VTGFAGFDLAIKSAPTELRLDLSRLQQAWHHGAEPTQTIPLVEQHQ